MSRQELMYGIKRHRIIYYQNFARQQMREHGTLYRVNLFKQPLLHVATSVQLGRAIIGLAAVLTTDQVIRLLRGEL